MRDATSVSPSDLALAKDFVRRLAEQVDPRVFCVTLFGSRARGEADEESNLNLFRRALRQFFRLKCRGKR